MVRVVTFKNFQEFYPYYLKQHMNPMCQRLHFVGTCLTIMMLITFFATGDWPLLVLTPVVGYGVAWVGHYAFEKNRPLTFKHPIYSLMADFVLFWQILTGKIKAF